MSLKYFINKDKLNLFELFRNNNPEPYNIILE